MTTGRFAGSEYGGGHRKQVASKGDGLRIRRRCGRRQQAHELSKQKYVARGRRWQERRDVARAFRVAGEAAPCRFHALLRKQLIGDALFDVVGLPGENHQGFVLRLPAEAGDGTVVAVAVFESGDTEELFGGRVGVLVSQNRGVGDGLDQPTPEDRSRYAKDHVVSHKLGGEIRLRQVASGSVGASSDREQTVDAPVPRTIGIELESSFANRAIYANK